MRTRVDLATPTCMHAHSSAHVTVTETGPVAGALQILAGVAMLIAVSGLSNFAAGWDGLYEWLSVQPLLSLCVCVWGAGRGRGGGAGGAGTVARSGRLPLWQRWGNIPIRAWSPLVPVKIICVWVGPYHTTHARANHRARCRWPRRDQRDQEREASLSEEHPAVQHNLA